MYWPDSRPDRPAPLPRGTRPACGKSGGRRRLTGLNQPWPFCRRTSASVGRGPRAYGVYPAPCPAPATFCGVLCVWPATAGALGRFVISPLRSVLGVGWPLPGRLGISRAALPSSETNPLTKGPIRGRASSGDYSVLCERTVKIPSVRPRRVPVRWLFRLACEGSFSRACMMTALPVPPLTGGASRGAAALCVVGLGVLSEHFKSRAIATWLILPVVICLSQRLSHACLSTNFYIVKPRMAH